MNRTSRLIQVVTTTATEQEAHGLAESLVRRKLAACAQVSGPIQSYYWWKDRVESTPEWKVTFKTAEASYAEVEAAIKGLHAYEVPQIVALPVLHSLKAYETWALDALSP